MRLFGSMLMILPATLALASCTTVNGGLRSFNAGDCAGAVRQWLPLAQRGDPGAQNNMGIVLEQGCQKWGDGIVVNHPEADLVIQQALTAEGSWAEEFTLAFLAGATEGYSRSQSTINVSTRCRTQVVDDLIFTRCN